MSKQIESWLHTRSSALVLTADSKPYRTVLYTCFGFLVFSLVGCKDLVPKLQAEKEAPPAQKLAPPLTPAEQFKGLIPEQIKTLGDQTPKLKLSAEYEFDVLKTDSVISPWKAYFVVSGQYPVDELLGEWVPHHGTVFLEFRADFAWQENQWVRKGIELKVVSLDVTPEEPFGDDTFGQTNQERFDLRKKEEIGKVEQVEEYASISNLLRLHYGGVSMVDLIVEASQGSASESQPNQSPATLEEIVEKLREMDQDDDGQISRAEATGRIKEIFKRIDRDDDGKLSRSELQKFLSGLDNADRRRRETRP